MAGNQTTFSDRLARIETTRRGDSRGRRRGKPREPKILIHADGVVQPTVRRSRHLRFGFPIKGVILSAVLSVLVKGYLMWTLGDDVYGLAVAELLAGNQFERAAGLVLLPDAVSNAVVDLYQYAYRFLVSLATALETGTFPALA
jgi:hypothetical protein